MTLELDLMSYAFGVLVTLWPWAILLFLIATGLDAESRAADKAVTRPTRDDEAYWRELLRRKGPFE